MNDEPLVSVVIPTRNDANNLDRCLASIQHQTYGHIETIVVDAYSGDGVADVAEAYDVTFVLSDDGTSEARNTGIDHASGQFLLSIDADMELEPSVIEQCVKTYRNEERVGGVVIPECSVGDGYWVGVRDHERSFYERTAIESARFFPMDAVRHVGGYDEHVTFFEESTLPQRIERETDLATSYRADETHIRHHEEEFSLLDWLGKKYRYGRSASRYVREYDRSSDQVNPISRYRTFLTAKRFYTQPHLAVGVLMLKTMEYTAAGIGLLTAEFSQTNA